MQSGHPHCNLYWEASSSQNTFGEKNFKCHFSLNQEMLQILLLYSLFLKLAQNGHPKLLLVSPQRGGNIFQVYGSRDVPKKYF